MYNNVNDFVARLEQNLPQARTFVQQRKLDKVYLNAPTNLGRYQVLPFTSLVTDYPYVDLPKTREINIPRKNIKSDGTENVYQAWVKLLPKSAYVVKDETGRITSSLTAANEQLLDQAYTIHEQLFLELDVKNNAMDPVIGKLIRKKNYTIFHAFCVNKWALDNMRTPERQNFSALFVVTSNKFQQSLKDDISQFSVVNGCGDDWLNQVYNRDLTDRQGFLMFTAQRDPSRPGFNFTTNHAIGKGEYLKPISIDPEDVTLMEDPVETFLGWQAGRYPEGTPVGQRRLFNEALITEAINFMTKQLAQIRMAKQSGGDIKAAIAATNDEALNSQTPTTTMGQQTNDPMLAQMAEKSGENMVANPQAVVERNTDPFNTPPAAHIDPVTGNPTGGNNFAKPSFMSPGFGGETGNGLPF